MTDASPVVPDYDGAAISAIVPALAASERPAWLPAPVREARQVVLLVLDGLGWQQLRDRAALAPTLASMEGGAITSVAPTTTSTALTSIMTGTTPGQHGVIGYRVHVGEGEVLNVLRWTTAGGDAIQRVPPESMRAAEPFGGRDVPVVTRAEFHRTGFTRVLVGERAIVAYYVPSSIAVEVKRMLATGAELVYAYYDGIDRIAHAAGFGAHYDAELASTDRLVTDLVAALPSGAALLVTSDHGQVDVGSRTVELPSDVMANVRLLSGEARFRWLHVRDDTARDIAASLRSFERDGVAWVRTRDEAVAEGWFGANVRPAALARMGDVLIAARDPVAFADPAEASMNLVCRHGSLTADEMLVPLLGCGA